MDFKFLGGANKIGSTGLLIKTNNSSTMFDYGLVPASPPQYPIKAPPVDFLLLGHAHLDHCGMIPWLTSKYDLQFFTTNISLQLAQILLRDNLKISEIEGYPCMYSKADIRQITDNYFDIKYGSKFNLNDFELTVHSAGHIPGSCMFQANYEEGLRILYTGDINTIDTRLVPGTKGIKCDVLILETTYAGRNHELRQKIEYSFLEKIKEIVEGGGKAIIPAFAVGRTQELLLILADLDYEVWLDGLGGEITRLMLKNSEFIQNEKKLRKMLKAVHRVRNEAQRKNALGGEVILTTSGMLDGGPVLRYIKELNGNPKNGLLLTGYQVEGSNGRNVLNERIINLYGSTKRINMDVQFFDFSAHAGHNELVNFIHACSPQHIILYHGDNREAIKNELESQYHIILPEDGETFQV
jgi:putative mRNA 3-end processing factor